MGRALKSVLRDIFLLQTSSSGGGGGGGTGTGCHRRRHCSGGGWQ